ncbi:Uncharacterised protein [uncultured archaeon]|nr:Uncharacterised protein [uncultured archaeon]
MVLKPIDKRILKRMRVLMKREQKRTGKPIPKRALRLFGRLRNIDERKIREYGHIPGFIEDVGRKARHPGYAVRVMRVKGTSGIVLKYPTLTNEHYKVSPREEIRFTRRMVELVNQKFPNGGFRILKPIGYPVGPFIAMRKTSLPVVDDFYRPERLTPKAKKTLARLSKQMGMSEEEIRKRIIELGHKIGFEGWLMAYEKKIKLANYPAGSAVTNRKGISFTLAPLDSKHLQIIGQKDGVIQFVPYIDLA